MTGFEVLSLLNVLLIFITAAAVGSLREKVQRLEDAQNQTQQNLDVVAPLERRAYELQGRRYAPQMRVSNGLEERNAGVPRLRNGR